VGFLLQLLRSDLTPFSKTELRPDAPDALHWQEMIRQRSDVSANNAAPSLKK
jgi:hypothetical protein